MEYFFAAILPLLISTGISIWLIPSIIICKARAKKRIVIALAIGEIINEINQIFEEIDCLDKSKRTPLFVNHPDVPKFICLALSFDSTSFLHNNKVLMLKNMSYTNLELIQKCDNEFDRFGHLRRELLNVSVRFSELIPNKILEQIADVCFEIGNLNQDNYQRKTALNNFKEEDPNIAHELANSVTPAMCLAKLYEGLFYLQHNLLNSNYFKKKL